MAIKLARSIIKPSVSEAPSTGFDLVFSDGVTYNLDEIFRGNDMSDSSGEFIIEVKSHSEIQKSLLSGLIDTLENTLRSTIDNDSIQNEIINLIQLYSNSPNFSDKYIHSQISYSINSYLKNIFDMYEVDFSINIDGEDIVIGYSFSSSDLLYNYLSKLYSNYSKEYADKLKVSNAGMGISDKKNKGIVTRNDYKKYLLD